MDPPKRKEELAPPTTTSVRASSAENKPIKRKFQSLAEEEKSLVLVKKRKYLSVSVDVKPEGSTKDTEKREEVAAPKKTTKKRLLSVPYEESQVLESRRRCGVEQRLSPAGLGAAEQHVCVPEHLGDRDTKEAAKRPATDEECSPRPVKKQRQRPSAEEGEQKPLCCQLLDARSAAEVWQQQYSAEESSAVSLLQDASVPLLDECEVERLSGAASKDLGCGAFGSCCRVGDPRGEELVIKSYFNEGFDDIVDEASILQRLQGVAGVQRLVGVCVRRRQLVTRYAGMMADSYFQTAPGLPALLNVVLQVTRTLQGLAGEGYSHNDVKGDNVCVRVGSRGPEATLIDLGMAGPVDACPMNMEEEAEPFSGPEENDFDTYNLAYTIETSLALHRGLDHAASLAPVRAWVHAAMNPGPAGSPTFEALIQELEALLGTTTGTPRDPGNTPVNSPPGGQTQGQHADTPRSGGLNQRRAANKPRPGGGSRRREQQEEGSEEDEGSEYH